MIKLGFMRFVVLILLTKSKINNYFFNLFVHIFCSIAILNSHILIRDYIFIQFQTLFLHSDSFNTIAKRMFKKFLYQIDFLFLQKISENFSHE